MALVKKSSRLRRIEKRKLLGALLIMAAVALVATFVTHYLLKANVDITKVTLISLIVGGLLAVFIEMRGTFGKRASIIKSRIKTERKAKSRKK